MMVKKIYKRKFIQKNYYLNKIDLSNNEGNNYSKGGVANKKNFSTLNLGHEDNIANKSNNIRKNNGDYISSTSFYGSYYNHK